MQNQYPPRGQSFGPSHENIVLLKRCDHVAAQHPHQAYTILTRSVIPKWRFVMRSTDVPPSVFEPLEEALQENFFEAAVG